MSSFFQDRLLSPLVFVFQSDFKASFSCSSSEAEGNICSNHWRVVLPSTGCRSRGGALQEHIPAAQPRGCAVPLPGRNAPRKPGSRSEIRIDGKWHCQDTRTGEEEEEEEGITGGSKDRNVPAGTKHWWIQSPQTFSGGV